MHSKFIITTLFTFATLYSYGQTFIDGKEDEVIKERPFQISLVPGFGTSRGAKQGYVNRFSLNLFAGYEYGFHGVELGGFYNINKHNIKGAQFAGFGNTVGGDVYGAQFGGFVNTVKGKVKGVQGAGYLNIVSKEVQGAQLAGYMNLADSVKGLQAAGIINVNRRNLDGTQLAGIINVAKDVEGLQVSGLVNKAKHIKGTQIGLINIADTVERGATVGLLNIVKKGKHQLAVEHNEVMDVNLAFRSGTDRLYSVLFAGIQGKSDFLWSYGLGFGTEFKFKNHWSSNVEITSQSINPKEDHHEELNLLNRLSWNFNYQMTSHLSISAGPAFNVYVTDVYDQESGRYGDDIDMGSFYNETFSGTNVKMWIGYNISVKF